MQKTNTSFIVWVGSKRFQFKRIVAQFPTSFNNYFEPFVGAGWVFFNLPKEKFKGRAFLSDINPALIDAYKVLKKDPLAYYLKVKDLLAKVNSKEDYLELSRQHPDFSIDEDEARLYRVAWFQVLLSFAFRRRFKFEAGRYLFHFGSFDQGHTNFRSNPINKPIEHYQALSELLQRADIKLQSYESIMDKVREGDLVYLDPPYFETLQSTYGKDATIEDQQAIKRFYDALVDKGAFVFLSLQKDPAILELFKGYNYSTLYQHRSFGNQSRFDLLVSNCKLDL